MLKHYLVNALHQFRRNRFTTIVNVLCLSLGICCFVVAYAVVSYLKSSEAAFANSERTYFVAQTSSGGMPFSSAAVAKYLKLDFPDLTAVARATGGAISLGDTHSLKVGDLSVGVSPVFADADLLKIFPLKFLAGDKASALSNPASIIFTEEAAQKYFGTTEVVGRRVMLNRLPATVTGVVAAVPQPSHLSNSPTALMRFEVLASMDVYERWTELQFGRDPRIDSWNVPLYLTYVQLPSDGSLTAAHLNTDLKSFGKRHVPTGQSAPTFEARPIADITSMLGDVFMGSVAALLLGLGGVVLLVACLNYANLATAQAASRAKEVGMRKVLGATRWQVMGQHFFETGLLTLTACGVALLVIMSLTALLSASVNIDLASVLTRSLPFFGFMAAMFFGVAILAGSYPAFVLSRLRPVQTLRAGRGQIGGQRFASWLVGVQFAAASLLVIAVVAIQRQNAAVHASYKAPADQVVVLGSSINLAGVSLDALRAELAGSSAITAVSAVRIPPWSPGITTARVSRSADVVNPGKQTRITVVAHDFFRTFGMTLLAGRVFDKSFNDQPAANTLLSSNVVIDQLLAEELGFSKPSDAVGEIVYFPAANASQPAGRVRIIGVIEPQQQSLIGMGIRSNIYSLDPAQSAFPVVRVSRNAIPEGLAAIDAAWKKLVPDMTLKRAFNDELFERGYRYFDGIRRVFTGVAIFAFAIAAMGLIGMAVHIVSRRQHEIGVRKTLGASKQRVLSMLMWDFSKPVLIANLIAWPLAFGVEQGYARVIVERAPPSLVPYLLGLVITLLIAWAAVGTQAYRAARLHPATVLRHE
jgi:putative ABC transport system permease protein